MQYQWYDINDAIISTTADLLNVPTGTYILVGTNAMGCSKKKSYTVPSRSGAPEILHIDTLIGACDGVAGHVNLTLDVPSAPVFGFFESDDDNVIDTSGVLAYAIDAPTILKVPIYVANKNYHLTLVDPNNNCRILVGTYSLPAVDFKILVTDVTTVRNDACGRHTGGIFNVGLSGETLPRVYALPPFDQVYVWTDSLGNIVGHIPDLGSVGKGTYTLTVKDIQGCVAIRTFKILDSVGEAASPALSNITMCLPGAATLSVINPQKDLKYRIYDSTQTPIAENDFGVFQETVSQTSKFYVTTIDGLCESKLTPVTITVIAPGVIIPNAFTPNNDGINDYWNIPHLDEFPGAEINVFNRDGQLVYHSINYAHPFDGKLSGKELPTGVYYYVIDLKQPECLGKVAGSVTILR